MKKSKWYIKGSLKEGYSYTLNDPSGTPILTSSKEYKTKLGCKMAIKMIQSNALGEIKDISK